ncbi:hypothetical protein [Haloquadratum walsbyi]|uniref:hypothetical protein n=1 Tax=Haloquadratum walsbyi TaxID=293091 RepID=UPI0026E9E1C4|nr:hypothetical protein [Haloquadratum walsbyi]
MSSSKRIETEQGSSRDETEATPCSTVRERGFRRYKFNYSDNGNIGIQKHDLTPIEQLFRAENLDEVIDPPSVRRAVSLFRNISEWGSRTPKGIVVKSSDRPLQLLSADRDESLCWKQYYRAAEALESLSEGAFTFVNSSKHGKMLVLHEHSETYQRLVSGALSSSSAGATV